MQAAAQAAATELKSRAAEAAAAAAVEKFKQSQEQWLRKVQSERFIEVGRCSFARSNLT
jgi:hypothetical protein